MRFVVDTNVLDNANRINDAEGDSDCIEACIGFLEKVLKRPSSIVLVDDEGLIMDEYSKGRVDNKQPRVGDRFIKYCARNMTPNGTEVEQISIGGSNSASWFDRSNAPPDDFDDDDKVFLAVAIHGNGKIVNSTDTDWRDQSTYLVSVGVAVKELCPHQLARIRHEGRA